ncbi:Sorting nexin mvp1 [Yamadazyma tenuis]|uniref:Sorting nexin mvp1 n=1 Tax=Candida tenuis TaxID=2315449 RepID=UPI0027A96A44|nr:Sorting nexin mvp1 [Yamadazyma tenuis]
MSGSNIYGSEDPWANGWTNDETPDHGSTTTPFNSVYLTPSQILTNGDDSEEESDGTNDFKFDEAKIPASYKQLYTELKDQLVSGNDFERLILDKLVAHHNFSGYQRTRIVNTIFDQNLANFTHPSNFFQSLGMVALELDLAGTGDYVTLQFKIADLPDIPKDIMHFLVETDSSEAKTFIDPLTSQLAESGIDDDTAWGPGQLKEPLLAETVSPNQSTNTPIEEPAAFTELKKYINDYRDMFRPLYDGKQIIFIKEVPEKEGLIFKHINYAITHQINLGMNSPAGLKKVLRRYSDFVWLLEFLLKKYPFRVIPGLPPKKFNGASPDSQFLQRRRRGLYRFLNQIIKHPVLRKDPVVITFLSVPTDLVSWRKQAQIDYSLEFKGIKISPHFMNKIWPAIGEDFMKKWHKTEQSLPKIIEVWTKLVILIERYEKRQQQIAYDNNKFVEMLGRFQDLNNDLYPHLEEKDSAISANNHDDFSAIDNSLNTVSEFFTNSSQAIVDETFAINTSVLEKFKNFLDYLYSLVELFERHKRLSTNTISQLQNRIRDGEAKFNRLSDEDADIKGSDLAKMKQSIINDKQEMFQQLNKDWLIKERCLQEYLMFQETQYLLSEMWIDWSRGRTKFHGKLSSLYDTMDTVIQNDMPLSR